MFLLFAVPTTIFDLREYRIPDALTFGGIAAFFVLKLLLKEDSFLTLCGECFIGFGAFWLIRIFSKGRMGLGDAKFSALIAVAAGISLWCAALFIASLIALAWAGLLIGVRKADRRTRIPLAPFLTLGAVLALLLKSLHIPLSGIGISG